MRISDWSSDVCSSDLPLEQRQYCPQGSGDAWPVFAARTRRARRQGGEEGGDQGAGGQPVRRRPRGAARGTARRTHRSEEHTSELQSLMRISYAVFCLKKKKKEHKKQRKLHTTSNK